MSDIYLVINAINQKLGYKALFSGKGKEIVTRRLSSGIKVVDWITGGGFPIGKITELYGTYGSGKSLICTLATKQAQQENKTVVWVDTEHSVDKEYMIKLGVNTEDIIFCKPVDSHPFGENIVNTMVMLLKMGRGQYKNYPKIELIIVDSLAGLVSRDELERNLEDSLIAPNARMINKAIRKLNAVNRHTAIIFINQLRTNIGFRAIDVTPGGRGLGFFAALRIQTRILEKLSQAPSYLNIQSKEKVIGQRIACRVTKSKVCPPFRETSFDFFFDIPNIDTVRDNINAGILAGNITKAGPYYSYNNHRFHGEQELAKYMSGDNDEKTFRST